MTISLALWVFLSSYIYIGVTFLMDRYSSTCLPSDYLEQAEIPIVIHMKRCDVSHVLTLQRS